MRGQKSDWLSEYAQIESAWTSGRKETSQAHRRTMKSNPRTCSDSDRLAWPDGREDFGQQMGFQDVFRSDGLVLA